MGKEVWLTDIKNFPKATYLIQAKIELSSQVVQAQIPISPQY